MVLPDKKLLRLRALALATLWSAQLAGALHAAETASQHGGLLVVTGYWRIDHSKRGGRSESDRVYLRCMDAVLGLNAPMVAYGDSESLAELRAARARVAPRSAPALREEPLGVEELEPCKHHQAALSADPDKFTNDGDVPSVDLGCIWDSKPTLLQRSMLAQPEFDWYAWLDVCMGHGAVPFPHGGGPWPSAARLQALQPDRITVSYSGAYGCVDCRQGWYYCHCLAGTAFVVPRHQVEALASNFSRKVDTCFASFENADDGAYVCLSDQVIMTKLLLDLPGAFLIASSGYGAVATTLLTESGAAAA